MTISISIFITTMATITTVLVINFVLMTIVVRVLTIPQQVLPAITNRRAILS